MVNVLVEDSGKSVIYVGGYFVVVFCCSDDCRAHRDNQPKFEPPNIMPWLEGNM